MGILDDILEAIGLKSKSEPKKKTPAAEAAPPEPEPADAGGPDPSDHPEPEDDDDPTIDTDADDDDDDDDDDEDSDDFARDYDLEEKDDFASFDVRADLKGFYVADKEIEAAWEDKDQRLQVLAKFGIRDEPHYYQVKASIERFIESAEATQIYGGPEQIMQLQMNAVMEGMKAAQQQRAEAMSAELEPVQGISLQQWAGGQAALAQGKSVDEVLADVKVDRAAWDAASAEWNARMSRDTTATIATEYGKYFSGAGQSQFSEAGAQAADAMTAPGADVAGEEPIPFERWVEIQVAMDKGTAQGKDPAGILAGFGMNAADWGTVSGWWSQKFTAHAYDQGFLDRYNQLQAEFEAKYAAGDPDSDIEF